MTPEELRSQHIAKRQADIEKRWEGREKQQSPPCETCGKVRARVVESVDRFLKKFEAK